VGHALGLPGAPTVSLGVVSALGRPLPGTEFVFEGFVQTDAAVNPGNSGGPLASISGEVMGVTSAVVPFAQGVGFAVPSNTVRDVVRQIRVGGRVVRPWLGISAVPLANDGKPPSRPDRSRGVLLAEVVRGGPAATAGLRSGDVLLRLAGEPVRTLRELLQGLARLPIGASVDLRYGRDGHLRESVVRIAEAPGALRAPTRGARRP
jgi:serine protease Do